VESGSVRNQLEIHLTNKRGVPSRYRLNVRGPDTADVRLGQTTPQLPALGDARIPLVITLPADRARPGLTFDLEVTDDQNASRRQQVRFVAPPGVARP
jgi:hypothetical protein